MVNLKPAPDNEDMFHRMMDETSRIEMGVWPTIFGYRVRAGYVGSPYIHLDWCAGGDQNQVERLYSILYAILNNRAQENVFAKLPPCSKIKPYYNDSDFCMEILSHINEESIQQFTFPSLEQTKREWYLKFH